MMGMLNYMTGVQQNVEMIAMVMWIAQNMTGRVIAMIDTIVTVVDSMKKNDCNSLMVFGTFVNSNSVGCMNGLVNKNRSVEHFEVV